MNNMPRGVFPTMITPFKNDGSIDYDGTLALIEWYAKNKVSGIFALCQSSEIFFLSFEEKKELLRFILKNRPKGMTIIASGHTADDKNLQIKEAYELAQMGADAIVLISNRLVPADTKEQDIDNVLLYSAKEIADSLSGMPLGVYECPYPNKQLLSLNVLKALVEDGRFQFLKDTCCDTSCLQKRLDLLKDTSFQLYNANAATLLDSLRMGAAGYCGVMANFHPELYVWLCENYNDESAELLQNCLGLLSIAEYQMYPVNAKYYLSLEGLPMEFWSRTKDAEKFTYSQKKEMEQMFHFTQLFVKADGGYFKA